MIILFSAGKNKQKQQKQLYGVRKKKSKNYGHSMHIFSHLLTFKSIHIISCGNLKSITYVENDFN